MAACLSYNVPKFILRGLILILVLGTIMRCWSEEGEKGCFLSLIWAISTKFWTVFCLLLLFLMHLLSSPVFYFCPVKRCEPKCPPFKIIQGWLTWLQQSLQYLDFLTDICERKGTANWKNFWLDDEANFKDPDSEGESLRFCRLQWRVGSSSLCHCLSLLLLFLSFQPLFV